MIGVQQRDLAKEVPRAQFGNGFVVPGYLRRAFLDDEELVSEAALLGQLGSGRDLYIVRPAGYLLAVPP